MRARFWESQTKWRRTRDANGVSVSASLSYLYKTLQDYSDKTSHLILMYCISWCTIHTKFAYNCNKWMCLCLSSKCNAVSCGDGRIYRYVNIIPVVITIVDWDSSPIRYIVIFAIAIVKLSTRETSVIDITDNFYWRTFELIHNASK